MGQGMCARIRDAANLAWKLALCIGNGYDDAVLDTYQSERHPHVRAFINGAVDLGRLVNASDTEAALKSAFRQPDGAYRMNTISPQLGPGLWQADSPAAGTIAPQFRSRVGCLSDDVTGYRSVMLVNCALLARWDGRALVEEKGIHVWHPDDQDGSADYLCGTWSRRGSRAPRSICLRRCQRRRGTGFAGPSASAEPGAGTEPPVVIAARRIGFGPRPAPLAR